MRIDIGKKENDAEDQTDGNERKAIIEKKKSGKIKKKKLFKKSYNK